MLRPWKLEIKTDPGSRKAIYLQIADAIIADIRSGRLKAGTALPGSRLMSVSIGVNRNTIVEALRVLLNEEWLVAKERKGTFVAETFPAFGRRRKQDLAAVISEETKRAFRITIDDGHPDSKIAPVAELARAYRQIFNRKARWQMMGYGNAYGDAAFRKAMASMLNHQRGMHLNEDLLCITRGSQMAMYLVAQCVLDRGTYIMVESPGYKPAWKAFERAGATLLPVRIDQEGLIIDDVQRHLDSGKEIKALYTTPHHQYPTTVTLSLQRRLQLIDLSNRHGFTIIEDDYDNEFHFGYRPVFPLSSFEELKSYAYIGTMSKVVAPSLRIGYVASNNRKLVENVAALRQIIDVQGDVIMEQAVLQLINDGTIKRHLKKATNHYRGKRDHTANLLNKYLIEKADYTIPDGGLACWIVPHKKVSWEHVIRQLEKKAISAIHPTAYSFDKTVNGLRLGYGSMTEKQLEEVILSFAALI